MATPGHADLVVDVVAGLAEEVNGALEGKTPTWRRITAEPSVLQHQRVGAVTQSACGGRKQPGVSGGLRV